MGANHQTKFRELVNNSSGRKQQVAMLPNSGPPPRHLLPAKLKPSPAVKMHPPGVILDFKGKAAFFYQLISEFLNCPVQFKLRFGLIIHQV